MGNMNLSHSPNNPIMARVKPHRIRLCNHDKWFKYKKPERSVNMQNIQNRVSAIFFVLVVLDGFFCASQYPKLVMHKIFAVENRPTNKMI